MKQRYSKVRIGVISIIFAMSFVFFFARLVYVQVICGDELRNRAERQYLRSIELPPERGEIFDTKGNKVVVNSHLKSLFAYPICDRDVDASYRLLSKIFRVSRNALKRQYNLRPKTFTWIKRGLTPEEYARFESANDQCGLFLREEPSRDYPYGNIGRAILGFVDLDNRGKSGIELVMENELAGQPGRSFIQTNGIGEKYMIQEVPLKDACPGRSIVLTVDWDKQQIVEEELARAVREHQAKGGMAVFLDPGTGAILAAADCDSAGKICKKAVKLKAVTNTFEPGSIYKLITAAAALEEGRVGPEDSFYAENGYWHMGRHSLRDDHKYDTLTFREAFELSSNIVMGKIANAIGGDNVYAMSSKFGFGRKVRCGLNGESPGILRKPNRWSEYTTSAFAIGHSVSVTPLQMAQAFAVVAAGGNLCHPHFIAGCINDEGHIIERHTSRPIKILDDQTVAVLDSFMRGVVERGTGEPLRDAPFAIAGKTGTAEKPNLEEGGYHKHRFMASFAGYFPADSPQVAGIVVLDEPEPVHYGGHTAGPAFKNIAVKFAALDRYEANLGYPAAKATGEVYPEVANASEDLIEVPDIVGDSRGKARYLIEKSGLKPVFSGPGDEVIATRPAALSRLEAGNEVYCYVISEDESSAPVPDLKGLTIREAVSILKKLDLPFDCTGSGRVVRQAPDAGETLAGGDVIEFECSRNKGV